jgi:hypothetical protein
MRPGHFLITLQQQLKENWKLRSQTAARLWCQLTTIGGRQPVTVEEEEETPWPSGPGPVEGEEAA